MFHAIIGGGVAGITAAQTIKRSDPGAEVHVFGAEPYPYYRRPLLWELIAGQIEQGDLFYRPAEWYAQRGIQLHLGVRASKLDAAAHRFTLHDGTVIDYDRLVLATGARSAVPQAAGVDKAGVFTLRTLDDALAIKAYAQTTAQAIVIGGGLLGLETARALRTAGLKVTVIELFPYLLPRQLDVQGAEVLQSLLEDQGLNVLTHASVKTILGNGRVDGILLEDGREVAGELVLCSTGIRSEVGLARAAGLKLGRGVVVDQHLRTSAEDVFAAGDVAEFEGRVYGTIPPAIAQARVAAANMVTPGSATYPGTVPSTTLKVVGAELTSLGECLAEGNCYTALRYADSTAGHYRKFLLDRGRVIGAIVLNDSERVRPITQLIEQGVDVSAYADRLLDDDFDLTSLLA